MKFNVGDTVTWVSQSGGYEKRKTGMIVEIVPSGVRPITPFKNPGFARREWSYVVRVPNSRGGYRLYWPRTNQLQLSKEEQR